MVYGGNVINKFMNTKNDLREIINIYENIIPEYLKIDPKNIILLEE